MEAAPSGRILHYPADASSNIISGIREGGKSMEPRIFGKLLNLEVRMKKRASLGSILMAVGCLAGTSAQAQLEWNRVEEETIRHFQALLRLDTSSPPGNESRAADYLKQVLESDGIPVRTFVLEPGRANLVAMLKEIGRAAG